jgi:hypothetical protein
MIPTYDGDRMYRILDVEYRGELSRILPDALTFKVAVPACKGSYVTAAQLCHCLLTVHRLDRYERRSHLGFLSLMHLNDSIWKGKDATALEKLAEASFIDVKVGKKFQDLRRRKLGSGEQRFQCPA